MAAKIYLAERELLAFIKKCTRKIDNLLSMDVIMLVGAVGRLGGERNLSICLSVFPWIAPCLHACTVACLSCQLLANFDIS